LSLVSRPRPRGAFVLALLTTSASILLGVCNMSDHRFFPEKSANLALPQAALAGADSPDAASATAQWAAAYAKNPQEPRTALGYAGAFKATGSKDQAMEVLKVTNMVTYARALVSLRRLRIGASSDERSFFGSERSVRKQARARNCSAGLAFSDTSSTI